MPWNLITAIEVFCNVLSFCCMRIDKRRAIQHTRRIPERTLLLLTFLGPLGTLAAMCFRLKYGRHKSQKPLFWLISILSVLLHTALYVLVFL